jgi:hypothetical protein
MAHGPWVLDMQLSGRLPTLVPMPMPMPGPKQLRV